MLFTQNLTKIVYCHTSFFFFFHTCTLFSWACMMVNSSKHQCLDNVSLVHNCFSSFARHFLSTTADVNYQTRWTWSEDWLWSRLSLNALIQHMPFSSGWCFLRLKVLKFPVRRSSQVLKQTSLCIELHARFELHEPIRSFVLRNTMGMFILN